MLAQAVAGRTKLGVGARAAGTGVGGRDASSAPRASRRGKTYLRPLGSERVADLPEPAHRWLATLRVDQKRAALKTAMLERKLDLKE